MKYIAIILFVLLSIPAFSCECKEIKDLAEAQKREYSESDVILIGEVVSSDSDKGTYKVKVVEVLKGALTQKLITGKYISTCELFPHKVGEMWLIYARQLQDGAINLNGCGLSRSFNHPYIIGYFGSTPPPPNPMSKDIVIEELNGKIKEADHLQKALILMKKEIEQLRKLK